MEYIRKIRSEGEKYGVCKIVPPDSWDPAFAINTEVCKLFVSGEGRQGLSDDSRRIRKQDPLTPVQKFFFKTRRQELNSVEGGKFDRESPHDHGQAC